MFVQPMVYIHIVTIVIFIHFLKNCKLVGREVKMIKHNLSVPPAALVRAYFKITLINRSRVFASGASLGVGSHVAPSRLQLLL